MLKVATSKNYLLCIVKWLKALVYSQLKSRSTASPDYSQSDRGDLHADLSHPRGGL